MFTLLGTRLLANDSSKFLLHHELILGYETMVEWLSVSRKLPQLFFSAFQRSIGIFMFSILPMGCVIIHRRSSQESEHAVF